MIESKSNGSYVVRFQPGHIDGATLSHELVLPIWKSNVSVTLMLDKRAKSALSLRLFGEDITTAAREANEQKKQITGTSGTPVPEDDVVSSAPDMAIDSVVDDE
ncbi:hypothetical protein A0H81_13282 [Grifola frondosa]|uniref:RNA cytosine-C(5)-methyltransferase NSUN2-like PUA domain-containing protein n=1 Tax=Grifola frondosa TaxID=5627 RepID=A0A1C7LPX4_GRIFR|nr:hypothetical protein A0H81_13282 [Grifola frondosa]